MYNIYNHSLYICAEGGMMRKTGLIICLSLLAIGLVMAGLYGVSPRAQAEPALTEAQAAEAYIAGGPVITVDIAQELVPLNNTPAVSTVITPVASGTAVSSNSKATVDYSNSSAGYIMIKYNKVTATKLKVLITGPGGVTYTYNLNGAGAYETFSLSDGNGSYSIGVYENISGSSYAAAHTAAISVTLKDEFAPFLAPNQYVNFTAQSQAVAKAAELTADKTTTLAKVEAIYNYVVNNISYDYDKAKTVTSGYLPAVDNVLLSGKGICSDYSALITAMLRSQGIPTKLVVGYSGSVYHAWINTYSAETGWVSGIIYFDGCQWKLMDPTYASSSKQSAAVMQYIGNGANYSAKYLY